MNYQTEVAGLKKEKERLIREIEEVEAAKKILTDSLEYKRVMEEKQKLTTTLKQKKVSLESVSERLGTLLSRSEPKLSEHAILRYLERVKGIDLDAITQEILTEERKEAIRNFGTVKLPLEKGAKLVVREGTIVTVTPKKEKPKKKKKSYPECWEDEYEY